MQTITTSFRRLVSWPIQYINNIFSLPIADKFIRRIKKRSVRNYIYSLFVSKNCFLFFWMKKMLLKKRFKITKSIFQNYIWFIQQRSYAVWQHFIDISLKKNYSTLLIGLNQPVHLSVLSYILSLNTLKNVRNWK